MNIKLDPDKRAVGEFDFHQVTEGTKPRVRPQGGGRPPLIVPGMRPSEAISRFLDTHTGQIIGPNKQALGEGLQELVSAEQTHDKGAAALASLHVLSALDHPISGWPDAQEIHDADFAPAASLNAKEIVVDLKNNHGDECALKPIYNTLLDQIDQKLKLASEKQAGEALRAENQRLNGAIRVVRGALKPFDNQD